MTASASVCSARRSHYEDDRTRLLDIQEAIAISADFRAQHLEVPWKEIIGMRNILVHHYFGIDFNAVWSVVEHDLPDLKRTIATMLEGQP